ncbi:hypothetical protein BKA65DRAFT_473178 [Rhexocercosporidium sp. MPI-PUGE-AT-0058]|nr:hypothetical protein BKA65DRAFT_473178 [Rhexocercosporidium sp. MPI-PUGE-AT-0058]
MPPSSDIMPEPTITIEYMVLLGDPRLRGIDGAVCNFTFSEQAPAFLCTEIPEDSDPKLDEYKDALSRFQHSLGVTHCKNMLLTRPFKCIVCPRPATSTVSCSIPRLSTKSGHEPKILDFQAPVCITGGMCDGKARKIVQEEVMSLIPKDVEVKTGEIEGCRTCGNTKGVKLCGGCNSISYCSKECQSKNWAYHKDVCKIIRFERAMQAGDIDAAAAATKKKPAATAGTKKTSARKSTTKASANES